MTLPVRPLTAAILLLLISSRTLPGQQPHALGSAAALGGAAVTEARRGDGGLWNPALVGVYDGPESSFSLLSLDVRAIPSSDWASQAAALGLNGPGLARYPGRAAPERGPGFGEGSLRWLATQHRALAVTISSTETAGADVPEGIGRLLGGSAVAGPAPDSALHAFYTLATMTHAAFLRRMPLIGSVWVGATGKAWVVHSYAKGEFVGDSAGERVYREVGVRGVPGYGVDLGVLVQPADRLRVGASISNVAAGAFRPEKGPRVREVSVLEGPRGIETAETVGPHLGPEDAGTGDGQMAAALWSSLSFPMVVRAGASFATGLGSLAGAWRSTLRAGGLDRQWLDAPNTLAFAGSNRLPVRVSYSWGDGSRGAAFGLLLGPCERRWAFALERRAGRWGTTTGASASVTIGSRAGCDEFRS